MTAAPDTSAEPRLRVLIAGGGIAALEAAFALRTLAGDRVRTSLLTAADDFLERPRTIGEPFNRGHAERYALVELAERAGAELIPGALVEVDGEQRTVRTSDGGEHPYDALIIATGAALTARFPHATTLDDACMDELLHGLVLDIEQGYVRDLAIVLPTPISYPLPAYEVALMASERAWDMQVKMNITVLTPERSPLEMFGEEASAGLAELLQTRGIAVVTSAVCEVPTNRTVVAHPSGRTVEADRIVALPELKGPSLRGLPSDGGGFLPIDRLGRVRGAERVWAAGDATDYPIKQGGVAAGLADVVAQQIAELAGVPLTIEPFAPALRAVLMTGGSPRYLSRQLGDGQGTAERSALSETPLDGIEDKVHARYLTPQLHQLRPAAAGAGR